tara:strand:- start:9709 stop:10290 length:582 start_codon:yes stop_codon:yes gene_type:complete
MTYSQRLNKHRINIIILQHLRFNCAEIHYLLLKRYGLSISYKALLRYLKTITIVELLPVLSKKELDNIYSSHKYFLRDRRKTHHKQSKLFSLKNSILRKFSTTKNIRIVWLWLINQKKLSVAYSTVRRFILTNGGPVSAKKTKFLKFRKKLIMLFKKLGSYHKTHQYFILITNIKISYSTVRRIIKSDKNHEL